MKKEEYILPALFILAPFLILARGYIWHGQQIGLMVIFLVILATMIENKLAKTFLFYVAVWQAYLFYRALINPSATGQALNGFQQVLFMFAGAIIYLKASRSKLHMSLFYNIICIGALIQTSIALLQKFTGIDLVVIGLSLIAESRSSIGDRALVGMLGNPNYLAAFLAISLPFFFRGKIKSFLPQWWWGIIPVSVGLILSMTSAAVIPALIGCGIFIFLRYRPDWKNTCTFITCLLFAAFYYTVFYDNSSVLNNERFGLWKEVFNQVITSPLGFASGIGPAAKWAHPYPMHSEWVTLFHQFGFLGLVIAGGFIFTIPRKNIYLLSAFVIAIINMAGNAALHIPVTAFLICMIAGLMERGNG